MFTGLIETTGKVVALEKEQSGVILTIAADFQGKLPVIGDSIAINGACLTVTDCGENQYSFYISYKTLELTGLGNLQEGSIINTERAMLADTRFGGHIVSGHVDCTGEVLSVDKIEGNVFRYIIQIPEMYAKYIVERGSICVDGISLTIVSVSDNRMELVLIPETLAKTNASGWQAGYAPNIEFDLLMRYVESLLGKRS